MSLKEEEFEEKTIYGVGVGIGTNIPTLRVGISTYRYCRNSFIRLSRKTISTKLNRLTTSR